MDVPEFLTNLFNLLYSQKKSTRTQASEIVLGISIGSPKHILGILNNYNYVSQIIAIAVDGVGEVILMV